MGLVSDVVEILPTVDQMVYVARFDYTHKDVLSFIDKT